MNILGAALDIMAAVIIIIIAATSIRRGIAASIAEFVGVILSTVAAAFLAAMTSSFIYAQFIRDNIIETISNAVSSGSGAASVSVFNSLPGYVQTSLLSQGINENNILAASNGSDIPTAVEAMVRPVVVSFITEIALTIIFTILFVIVIALTNKLFKSTRTSEHSAPEKLMCCIFGALKAAVILMVIAILIQAIVMLMPQSAINSFNTAVDNSFLYKFIIKFLNIPLFVVNLTAGI